MEERENNLSDLFDIVRRRKLSLILPAVLVFLISVIAALAWPPTYKSTSTILIEEQEISHEFVVPTVTTLVERRLEIIKQRIISFPRLLEIINQFDLYADKREKWTTEEIVEEMRDHIEIEPLTREMVNPQVRMVTESTFAFRVSFVGKNPEIVQQVANRLASLYKEENLAVRKRQATEASTFLEEEMKSVKDQVAELDAKIAQFKEEHIHELPELLEENMSGLDRMEMNIERLTDQLRSLKEREGFTQAQLAGVPRQSADKQRLDELKVQLTALQARFSDQYPEIIKTKAEIVDLEKRLSVSDSEDSPQEGEPSPEESPIAADNPVYVNLASQLASTQAEIELVKKQIEDAKQQRKEYQRRIEGTPRVEEEYRSLLMERDNTHQKYNDLMAKHMEAKVYKVMEEEQKAERFQIVDPARLPEKPSSPNRLAIILIGLVLSIGAGVGMAAFREFTDTSIRNENDLALMASFPVLGGVPYLETASERSRKKRRRIILTISVFAAIIAGILIFHFFIMDLDIFWAKLSRRMGW